MAAIYWHINVPDVGTQLPHLGILRAIYYPYVSHLGILRRVCIGFRYAIDKVLEGELFPPNRRCGVRGPSYHFDVVPI